MPVLGKGLWWFTHRVRGDIKDSPHTLTSECVVARRTLLACLGCAPAFSLCGGFLGASALAFGGGFLGPTSLFDRLLGLRTPLLGGFFLGGLLLGLFALGGGFLRLGSFLGRGARSSLGGGGLGVYRLLAGRGGEEPGLGGSELDHPVLNGG